MKNKLVKLTESDLHNIVMESVRKVLKEDYCWYGDIKPVEDIYNAACEIASWHDEEDFEDIDDRAAFDLHQWAKKIAYDAESFMHHNSSNVAIGM